MACACKTNEQISYIQKKYGVKQPGQKETHFAPDNIWALLKDVAVFLVVVVFSPLMLLYTIAHSILFHGKPIDIARLFGLHTAKHKA